MSDGDGGEERVDVMTDADFDNAMEALQYEGGDDVGELLRTFFNC
jgi:hypothetical protein